MAERKLMKTLSGILVAGFVLGGCSNMSGQEQRTLSGGAIGAGAGAAAGVLTGGSWVAGSVLGGAAGAAIGAFTDEDDVSVDP